LIIDVENRGVLARFVERSPEQDAIAVDGRQQMLDRSRFPTLGLCIGFPGGGRNCGDGGGACEKVASSDHAGTSSTIAARVGRWMRG